MKNLLLVILVMTPFLAGAQVADEDILGNESGSFVTIPDEEYNSENTGAGKKDFNVYEKVDVKDYALPECKAVPLYIDKCLPSACQEITPFGKVLRKLKGKTAEGACEYVERTPGFGGQNCTFPADNLTEISRLFYSFNFAGEGESKLSNNEIEDYKFIMKQNCTPVDDSSDINELGFTSNPKDTNAKAGSETKNATVDVGNVSLDKTPKDDKKIEGKTHLGIAEAEAVKPEVNPEPTPTITAETKATTAPNLEVKESATGKVVEVKEGENAKEISKKDDESKAKEVSAYDIKSVMFTENEIDQINEILGGFSIIQQKANSNTEKKEEKSTRNFYLSSIIYYTAQKWTLWINEFKIQSGTSEAGLEVQKIAKDYAIIQWSTPSLDKISPNWKQLLTAVNDDTYVSKDNNIQVYLSGSESAVVSFKISPHQTFEAGNMRIKEGKL